MLYLHPLLEQEDYMGWLKHRNSDAFENAHTELLGLLKNEATDLENRPG